VSIAVVVLFVLVVTVARLALADRYSFYSAAREGG
jgi:hypothetical protein